MLALSHPMTPIFQISQIGISSLKGSRTSRIHMYRRRLLRDCALSSSSDVWVPINNTLSAYPLALYPIDHIEHRCTNSIQQCSAMRLNALR
jgi:hypothetical protein